MFLESAKKIFSILEDEPVSEILKGNFASICVQDNQYTVAIKHTLKGFLQNNPVKLMDITKLTY